MYIKNYTKKTSYTWRSDWIVSSFESPWGIFEKFKYANGIKSNEIIKIFGNDTITDRKNNFWTKSERNLLNLYSFDEKRLTEILGHNIKELNELNINNLISTIYKGKDKNLFIWDNVQICPECIKYGFHSIFHQLIYIDKCPYHQKDLITRCPKCKRTIPYLLIDNWSSNPFTCKCEYLWGGEKNEYIYIDYNYIRQWTKAKEFMLKSDKLIQLINLDTNKKELLNNIYFNNNLVLKHRKNFLSYFLSLTEKYSTVFSKYEYKHFYINNSNIPILNISEYIKTHDSKNIDYKILFIDVLNELNKNNFKAVANNIRTKILRKHKTCIVKMIRNRHFDKNDNLKICPYAYAYVMWRRELESFKYHWQVHNRASRPKSWRKEYVQDDYLFFNNIVLYDLYYSLLSHNNLNNMPLNLKCINKESINDLLWVFNRLYLFYLTYSYNNWLRLSENFIKMRYFEYNISKEDLDIPFYLIRYSKESRKIEFHWWETKKNDLPYKCPFNK